MDYIITLAALIALTVTLFAVIHTIIEKSLDNDTHGELPWEKEN